MLNNSTIKDANYLQGQRRTVLPDLQDKNWRCSTGTARQEGGKGGCLSHSPFCLNGLDADYRPLGHLGKRN